ncbi:putative disease resistance protein RGA3 [Phragmites australis]|uniref:putative disease resistance protein RGA3 n=1 Tax=Phragmites australis TaxID=29695 RepID=UPI002D790847|nr:putative disease resistance protein RGA3 [Phragmites australis]
MEAAISAITGDLISRVLSYLIRKCTDKPAIDESLERLQQLLLRIHAVVEEADGRYITNSRMLIQLKLLVESMYQGYHMLDIFRYKSLVESFIHDDSKTSSIPSKRSRTISSTMRSFAGSNNVWSVLKSLEGTIANMTEFVVLLGGCERICHRPYDTYLYIDHFMFGRHVEKQQIMNTLLNDPGYHGAPTVLPVIGGCRVGKKTLVSHVSKNDRIQSHFSSILFINGDSIWRMENAKLSNERTLAVVEFVTDVDDDNWVKFYSTIAHMTAEGSKVIIISRIRNLARFGTVKTIFLNSFSHEEYRYLFKKLAFGSTDEKDHPHLVSIANELAIVLRGSLVTANVIADLLRRNIDIQFWLRIFRRFKGMVDYNLSKYSDHPKDILDNERPIDITTLFSSHPVSRCLMPPRVERDDCPKRKLAHVYFGDLMKGGIAIPNDEFVVVGWESRLPPYTRFVNDVECAVEKHGSTTSGRKRRYIQHLISSGN